MKRVLVMLGVALAMAPTLAFGAKWEYVTSSESGHVFFIHTESIQTSGNSRTFWYRANFSERDKFGDLSSRNQITINCARRESILRWLTTYDDSDNQGRVTADVEAPKTTKWLPIPPDSVYDGMRRRVCR